MTTEQNRRNHQRTKRRHALRRKVADVGRRLNCPHPEKPGYNLGDADEARLADRRGAPTRELYGCRCGYWHHTTVTPEARNA